MEMHEAIAYRKSLIEKAIEGQKLAENESGWHLTLFIMTTWDRITIFGS